MRILLITLLLLLALGALPAWPYSAAWGYYPSGAIGMLLAVFVLFVVFRRA